MLEIVVLRLKNFRLVQGRELRRSSPQKVIFSASSLMFWNSTELR